MENRFEFVIGVEDKQKDSTSFMYLTRKQMKALALILNIGIYVDMDENDESIEEVNLIQFGTLNQRMDDAFITKNFLSELMEVVINKENEVYKDDPNKDMEIKMAIEGIKRTQKEINDVP